MARAAAAGPAVKKPALAKGWRTPPDRGKARLSTRKNRGLVGEPMKR